jgi:hypothetical protein
MIREYPFAAVADSSSPKKPSTIIMLHHRELGGARAVKNRAVDPAIRHPRITDTPINSSSNQDWTGPVWNSSLSTVLELITLA